MAYQRKWLFARKYQAEAAFVAASKRSWAYEAATDALMKNEVMWMDHNGYRAGLVRPTQYDGGYLIVLGPTGDYRVMATNDWLEAVLDGMPYDNPTPELVELRELAGMVAKARVMAGSRERDELLAAV